MEEDLLVLKRGLSSHELEALRTEAERQRRSVGVAYALWFFLGWLGIQRLYSDH